MVNIFPVLFRNLIHYVVYFSVYEKIYFFSFNSMQASFSYPPFHVIYCKLFSSVLFLLHPSFSSSKIKRYVFNRHSHWLLHMGAAFFFTRIACCPLFTRLPVVTWVIICEETAFFPTRLPHTQPKSRWPCEAGALTISRVL